jgi:hypothetical protein
MAYASKNDSDDLINDALAREFKDYTLDQITEIPVKDRVKFDWKLKQRK